MNLFELSKIGAMLLTQDGIRIGHAVEGMRPHPPARPDETGSTDIEATADGCLPCQTGDCFPFWVENPPDGDVYPSERG